MISRVNIIAIALFPIYGFGLLNAMNLGEFGKGVPGSSCAHYAPTLTEEEKQKIDEANNTIWQHPHFDLRFVNSQVVYTIDIKDTPEIVQVKANNFNTTQKQKNLLTALAYMYDTLCCNASADLICLEQVFETYNHVNVSTPDIGEKIQKYIKTISLRIGRLDQTTQTFNQNSPYTTITLWSPMLSKLNKANKVRYKKAIVNLVAMMMGKRQDGQNPELLDLREFQEAFNRAYRSQSKEYAAGMTALGILIGTSCGYALKMACSAYLQNYKSVYTLPLLGISTLIGGISGYALSKR